MIPSFETYLRKYLGAVYVIVAMMAAFFALSITRNIIDISLFEMIFALGVITASLVYALVRDSQGYWFYVLRSGKVFDTKENRKRHVDKFATLNSHRIFVHPWKAALLGFVLTASVCVPAYGIWHSDIHVFIFVFSLTLLPAFVLLVGRQSAKVQLTRALTYLQTPTAYEGPGIRISHIVGADLLFTLLINFALVLPLERKPAFDLHRGYGDPAFVVAFLILMSIVFVFLMFFSGKSRRFSLTGELLLGIANGDFVRSTTGESWLFSINRWSRCGGYFIAVILWSILLCVVFDMYGVHQNFTLVYLVGLAPLALLYAAERYHALRRDFKAAQDIRDRLMRIGSEYVDG